MKPNQRDIVNSQITLDPSKWDCVTAGPKPTSALFIKSQQKVLHSPGVNASCVSSLHFPITWSEQERVAEYHVLAARYLQMADTEERTLVRGGLLELAGHCEAGILSNSR